MKYAGHLLWVVAALLVALGPVGSAFQPVRAQSQSEGWAVKIEGHPARAFFDKSDLVLESGGNELGRIPITEITEIVAFTVDDAKRTLELADKMTAAGILAGGGAFVPTATRATASLLPFGVAAVAGLQSLFGAKSHFVLIYWQDGQSDGNVLLAVDDDSTLASQLQLRSGLPLLTHPSSLERFQEELAKAATSSTALTIDRAVWTPQGVLKSGTLQVVVVPTESDRAVVCLQRSKQFDVERPFSALRVHSAGRAGSDDRVTYRYGGDAEMIADIRLPDRVLTVADQTTLAFGKVKVWLPKGNREKDVELVLTDAELLIRPDSRSVSASRIEWKQIEALSFERKRIGPGRRIAMLKHNWLVVKWTHSSGPERLHLHLDGDDIGALLAAISERSGVSVDGWVQQPEEGG